MSHLTLDTVGEVKRNGKIARKIFFHVNVAGTPCVVPLEKGAFLAAIKNVESNLPITAQFDGQDLTINS